MGKIDWEELILVPFLLAIGIMIAQVFIASTDEGVIQAGEYMRYLIVAAGAAWVGSLGWRFKH